MLFRNNHLLCVLCLRGTYAGEDGCTLSGNDRATIYTVTNYVCKSISDGSNTGGENAPTNPVNPDDGGGSAPCWDCPTQELPCNGNGVATGPLDPNTGVAEGGCSGVPTVIEFPDINSPCNKHRKTTTDIKFSSTLKIYYIN